MKIETKRETQLGESVEYSHVHVRGVRIAFEPVDGAQGTRALSLQVLVEAGNWREDPDDPDKRVWEAVRSRRVKVPARDIPQARLRQTSADLTAWLARKWNLNLIQEQQ